MKLSNGARRRIHMQDTHAAETAKKLAMAAHTVLR
jgi:hypothetical protein